MAFISGSLALGTALALSPVVGAGTTPKLNAATECGCTFIGDQEVTNGLGPCGLVYELRNLSPITSTACNAQCAPAPTSGCTFKVLARVTAQPIEDCEQTAAIVGWHITTQNYTIDCEGNQTTPSTWQASEGVPAQDPGGVSHRFGQLTLGCGNGFAYSMKVWYECPCPQSAILSFETPFRHMKCAKCCP